MGATARVNGHVVGVMRDQFLRYSFQLDPAKVALLSGAKTNRLDVTFGIGDVAEDGRFMACTGGWDWAPYSYTSTNSSGNTTGPANTLSKGIWKSVYLTDVPRATVAITHVTPHTYYAGAYPTARLADGKHGGFTVNVTAHLWVPLGGASGTLTVAGSWAPTGTARGEGPNVTTMVSSDTATLPAGNHAMSLQLTATAQQIQLWWPSGVGAQPLYNVTATWSSAPAAPKISNDDRADVFAPAVATAVRHFGFRVFAVVTVNDTNATIVANNASGQVRGCRCSHCWWGGC
jgi:beta-mannosidase